MNYCQNKNGSVLLIVLIVTSIMLLSAISLINHYSIEKQIEKNFTQYKKKLLKTEGLNNYVLNILKNSDKKKLKCGDFNWLSNTASLNMQDYKNWNSNNSSPYKNDNKMFFSVVNSGIKRGTSLVLKENNKLKPYEFIIYTMYKSDNKKPFILETVYIMYL